MSAVSGIARFDGRSAFGTWLYRIATNACIDELRRRRRRPLPGFDEEAARSSGDDAPSWSSRQGSTGFAAPRNATATGAGDGGAVEVGALASDRVAVDSALARLDPTFRTAVVLRDLCDLSYGEIAEVLEVPVGTVRSRIARGRAQLVPLLGFDEAPFLVPGGNRKRPPSVGSSRDEPTVP